MFLNSLFQEVRALKINRATKQTSVICVDSQGRDANARNPVRHVKQIRYNYL